MSPFEIIICVLAYFFVGIQYISAFTTGECPVVKPSEMKPFTILVFIWPILIILNLFINYKDE